MTRLLTRLNYLLQKMFLASLIVHFKKKGYLVNLHCDSPLCVPASKKIMSGVNILRNKNDGPAPEAMERQMLIVASTCISGTDSGEAGSWAPDTFGPVVFYRVGSLIEMIVKKVAGVAYLSGSKATTTRFRSCRGLYTLESDDIDVGIQVSPALATAALSVLMAALFASGLFMPTDDLARHAKAYLYDYDFRQLYPYSYHPAFNTYIGFDLALSSLYRLLGDPAFLIFQLVPFILTSCAICRLMKGSSRNMITIAVLASFYYTFNRYQSGRPCIWESSIFLASYAFKDDINDFGHFALGLLQSSLYYLFPIYTIPFILSAKRERIAYLAASCVGLLGWVYYSGGEYFSTLFSLLKTMSPEGIKYRELDPIFSAAALTFIAPIVPLMLYYRRDLRKTIATAFFLALNQVRYLETVIPLSLTYLKHSPVRVPFVAVAIAFSVTIHGIAALPYKPLVFPEGSYVMATSSYAMNAAVWGSGRIHITPSANLGWNKKEIVKVTADIVGKGTLDCSVFKRYHFDYLVENNLNGVPAECLELERNAGAFRIWKIKNEIRR